MGDPKRSRDNCRFCGKPVIWAKRLDPACPNDGRMPQSPMRQDFKSDEKYESALREYEVDRKEWRDWYVRKPYWHGKYAWYHEGREDLGDATACNKEDYDEDSLPQYMRPQYMRHYSKISAEPESFCTSKTNADSWNPDTCNRPVTYREDGHSVCGIHAKPFIRSKRESEAREQERQAKEAQSESLQQVIDRFAEAGITLRKEPKYIRGYAHGYTGRLSISVDDLLRIADSANASIGTSVPDVEVADGFNPFLDAEIDEDEEEVEWDEEFDAT